jgi:hypothetical protein
MTIQWSDYTEPRRGTRSFVRSTGRAPDGRVYTIRPRKRPNYKPRQRRRFMLSTGNMSYPGLGLYSSLDAAKAAAEAHYAERVRS